jgi:O-antigen/teichoic acid export membrane protein
MASLKQSLMLTFLSTNGATLVLFMVTVVLARLLSPEEIGIYSITAVLIAIAHFFRDFGVSSYLQQEKELSREKVASAFGVMLASSWLIASLTYLAAPWAASYYGQPGIQRVMEVLALGYVFIPFGSVTHSLLTRDYRAKEQAYVRVYGTTAYAISATSLAYLDFSYMSMPWANFINIVVTALAYARYTPDIAKCWPSLKGWKRVANFGAGATLGSSLNAVNNAIPDLVLGKISGPHAVGVMSRSISTTQLINQVLGPTISYAVLPYFSRTHHAGHDLSAILTKSCAYLTGIMWPAVMCTAVFALPLTSLLYGEQWLECAPLIQIICFMLFLTVPFNFLGTAFMAIGRPHLASIPTLLTIGLRGLCIWLAYDGSTQSFVWGLVAAALMMYPILATLQNRVFGLRWRDFMAAQRKSLMVTIVCSAAASASLLLPPQTPAALIVLGAGMVIPLVWLLSLRWSGHVLWAEVIGMVEKKPALAAALAKLKLI